MRHVIQKRVKFDIMDLNAVQSAPKTFIPALFGHAADDVFIQSHHSDLIYSSYAGDKNIIKFEGDHNSPRPQFYYDSVSIFFYNVLHPPQISSPGSTRVEKYYDLGSLKVGSAVDESLLYEIIAGLRSASSDAASSSSAPFLPKGPCTKSVAELLSESGAVTQTDLSASFLEEAKFIIEAGGNNDSNPHFLNDHQEKVSGLNEECCSYTSSNRESWGRCSSLGGISEEESSSAECVRSYSRHQMALKVLATPLRRIQGKSSNSSKKKEKMKKKKRKPKDEKPDKSESLSQRLRHCFLGRSTANNRRQSSS